MTITNDDRAGQFLGGENKQGVMGYSALLKRYLDNQNANNAPYQVSLDKRSFKSGRWSALPNTKTVGW